MVLCALALLAVGAIALPAGAPAGESSQATPAPVAQVTVGVFHSCAVLAGADIRCWGFGGDGQVGYGNTNIIGDDETPASVGPVNVGAGRKVRTVTAGDYHSCAVLDNGSVRCWGFAFEGQLGYGSPRNNIGDNETPDSVGPVNLGPGRTAKAISAGGRHTCAVLDDASVRCWGQADSGQLGYGNIGNATTVGDPGVRDPVNFGAGRTAKAISAGGSHTCAILDNDSVRCWGLGSNGQLGYGNTSAVQDPSTVGPVDLGAGRTAKAITAGAAHTCAVLDDGSVRCWGLAETGQLGYGNATSIGDNETPGTVAPVNLGSGRSAVAISAGDAHTCAALDDGSVRCWGSGEMGRLGYGNTNNIGDNETPASVAPVDVGTGRTALGVTAGPVNTCARLDNGSVRCWGKGVNGELGYCNRATIGDDETPATAGPVDLGAGGAGCPAGPPTPTPGPAETPTPGPAETPTPGPGPYPLPEPSPLEAALAAQKARAAALRACLRKAGKATGDQKPKSAKRRRSRRKTVRRRKACLKRHGRTPGQISRLAARATGRRGIRLSFRVAGTDGSKAPAARAYLVKQSRKPIGSPRRFARARSLCRGRCSFKVTRLDDIVKLNITNLKRRRTYYYAVRARDNVSARLGPRSGTVKARTR